MDQRHWPEYAMEAALLGAFMVSACVCTVLVEHPASFLRAAVDDGFVRRALVTGRFPVEAHRELLLGQQGGIKNVIAFA